MKVCRLVQKLLIVLAIISISLTGCARQRAATRGGDMLNLHLKNRGMAARDVAAKIKQDLTAKKAYGYVKPYAAITIPAEVRLVWIPEHMAEGADNAMVAGHWVYLKIRESQFYIQGKSVGTVGQEVVPLAMPVEPVLEEPQAEKEEEAE